MRRNVFAGGIVTWSFDSVAEMPVATHVATRLGGVSPAPWDSLNFSVRRGDSPENVSRNRLLLAQALEYDPSRAVHCRQVHGTGIAKVDAGNAGEVLEGCDGLVTDVPGLRLDLVFADCVPVFVYDPVRHVLGVVHSGWRGTVNGAASALVWAMQAGYDSRPADLHAGIGPSIGPASYEVGREVYELALARLPDADRFFAWPAGAGSNPTFDLWAANHSLLVGAGLPDERIEIAGIDTASRTDEFFSHRASGGRCGLFAMVAWLGARAEQVG